MENPSTESATHEAAPQSAAEETKAASPKNPELGVHAVLKNNSTGEVTVVKKTTRKELIKELSALNPDQTLLAIFKGKQLQLKPKTTFTFC